MHLLILSLGLALQFGAEAKISIPQSQASSEATKTLTLTIEGMHCQSCVSSLNRKVCKAFAEKLTSCKVELTKPQEETGTIELLPKTGEALDLEAIKKAVVDAGYTVK